MPEFYLLSAKQVLLSSRNPASNEKWDGIFHELTAEEIQQRYPEQIRLRERSGFYHCRAPGGENCPDVEMRIRSFSADLETLYGDRQVLVVGHENWFLLFQKIRRMLSVEDFLFLKQRGCKNCSITTYRRERGGNHRGGITPTPMTPRQERPHLVREKVILLGPGGELQKIAPPSESRLDSPGRLFV